MASGDLAQRLAFVSRGQRWVVRKMQTMLPTLADRDMHHALSLRLVAHEKNTGGGGAVAARRVASHGAQAVP